MANLRYILFSLIVIFVLAACQSEEVAIPTLASLPTVTPSDTPTLTPTETHTPSPTYTSTPSETPTQTPTPVIPTNTALPSATPTNTLTYTPIATDTPTVTLTPIPTRTPAEPEIILYQSNKETVTHGDTIILRWETRADEARLEVFGEQGSVLNTIPVETVGSLSTNVPSTGTMVTYKLIANRAGMTVSSMIAFQLTPLCTVTWFFENAPSSIGCPTGAAVSGELTTQQFERGFLFNLKMPNLDRICGIQNDRNLFSCFATIAYTGTPPVTPVPDREAPGAVFADVFYNQLAVGGFWYSIIGWGTSPPITQTVNTQLGENGKIYIQMPAGVYGFSATLTGAAQPVEHIQTQ